MCRISSIILIGIVVLFFLAVGACIYINILIAHPATTSLPDQWIRARHSSNIQTLSKGLQEVNDPFSDDLISRLSDTGIGLISHSEKT